MTRTTTADTAPIRERPRKPRRSGKISHRYGQIGSLSHGTMLAEDLIPTFADEIERLLKCQPKSFKRKEYRRLINYAKSVMRSGFSNSDYHDDVLDKLFDALSDFSPPYCYFGANEGDWSDYGFWPCLDDIERSIRFSDLSEVPDYYRGEILLINDHGNATLLIKTSKTRIQDIWAIV